MSSLVYIYGTMKFCFILVKPAVPGNVGAAARAIKTMGFSNLRLVNPCDHLAAEARIMAHASVDILESAEVFNSLDDAIAGLDVTIATTSGSRDARVEYIQASELPGKLQAKGDSVRTAGIVFGGEESGLSNDEIRMCDMVSTVNMAQPYPSLNLGQSVMIYAYSLSGHDVRENSKAESAEIDKKGFRVMMVRAKLVLKELGLDKNPALYNRLLERLATLEEDDIHLIHSILSRYESNRN